MKLIDADALIEYLKKIWSMWGEDDWYEAQAKDAMKDDIEIVNKQPTVDAVPVVRCRECKWAEVDAWFTYCKLGHKEDTTNSIIYTCTHNFYCADGERRTDEQQT